MFTIDEEDSDYQNLLSRPFFYFSSEYQAQMPINIPLLRIIDDLVSDNKRLWDVASLTACADREKIKKQKGKLLPI